MKTLHKDISFAYPTSPNAVFGGFRETGCWWVNRAGECHKAFPVSEKAAAIAYANTLPEEWSKFSLVQPDGSFFSLKSKSQLPDYARAV